MKNLRDTYKLSSGFGIPCIGFGTWQIPEGKTTVESVKTAIRCGYRHIDTAAIYGNEVDVGNGIKESDISRDDLFVTSKVWTSDRGYDKTLKAFDATIERLGLEYLDLYLIHWPAVAKHFDNWKEINVDTWRAMENLVSQGRVRSIGVSNFLPHHLTPLLEKAKILPAVDQIEYHPGMMQRETVDLCRQHGILIEAWSPLGSGRMLDHPTLVGIARRYQKSAAQICIRWALQNKVLPLPKSVTPGRIKENAAVFDFTISDQDMAEINAMPSFGGSGFVPDNIDF